MSRVAAARLTGIVDSAERLYHDVKLESVRQWRRDNADRGAVGFMPVWVPRELIHAAGLLPVGVMGGGEDVEIIKGDAYFQSYICHIPRSTIEMALNGALDPLDAMIFPSICDVIRNLSGMWQMIFPERPALYLDLPQSFDDAGRQFFKGELERLLAVFGDIAGSPVTSDALGASIVAYNENRALVRELYEQRREYPWRIPTSEAYLMLRAGNLLAVEAHNHLLADYLEVAPEADRKPLDNARVVVAGSFCEQPPLNLVRTIERSGCYIVDDDLVLGSRLLRQDVSENGDPITAIVDAFMKSSGEAAFLYRETGKGEELVERARRADAEGVLFCAPSFCDPALLDQPMLVAAVEAAGLPHTSFKYAENTGQFQVIREQAGTFADSIKLWSHT